MNLTQEEFSLNRAASKAISYQSKGNFLSVLLRRLRHLVIVRRVYLFEFRLRTATLPPARLVPPEYRLEFPASPNRLTPSALQGGDDEYAALMMRVGDGELLGLIWRGNRIVHRSLVQIRGHISVEGRRNAFALESNERYVVYCETVPEHCGRGLYPAMLYNIASRLKEQGDCARLLISCRTNNTASIRGILKAGFAYTATGLSFGVLSERFAGTRWRREVAPNLPLREHGS